MPEYIPLVDLQMQNRVLRAGDAPTELLECKFWDTHGTYVRLGPWELLVSFTRGRLDLGGFESPTQIVSRDAFTSGQFMAMLQALARVDFRVPS
jgi:hypothetical protein